VVQENRSGEWVKVLTANLDSEGKLVGGELAEPFWDAAEALDSRSATDNCASGGRCIFTMIDRSGDGNLTVDDNPPLEFHRDEESLLRPYLLSGGAGACTEILGGLPVPQTYDGSEAMQQLCSETIIDFIRGVDVFDYDSDGDATEDRPCQNNPTKSCKLGDIFHSSPIVVDPPVHPLVCTLGLHPQCLMTLYAAASDFAPVGEPLCTDDGPKPCYEATPMVPAASPGLGTYGAYEAYMNAQKHRDRFILVGANDGMLHAFLAGKHISGKDFGTMGDDIFDLGTGEEMWAFIPPDLLPKLARSALKHEYFVDGTPMVRDIWVDGSGATSADGKKQADEFHTVAMISERGGGQRYMALDVTNPWGMKTAGLETSTYQPFLWMYPNACDSEAYNFGQSWMNFSPKPPSIGPVRLKNDNRARGWDERWITFLNGGYSNDLLRGRGVYLVDIWTGERLWSFVAEMDAADGGGGKGGADYEGSVRDMLAPVAAAPAMLDVGAMQSIKADQDGFFDTVVVGDLGGQVWVFRMYEPGIKPADGQVTNWFGARALELDRSDSDTRSDRKLGLKTPFFNIASNTIQTETGWLRTFLGTGDKQNIRDKETSACGIDNLLACTRLGCKVKIDTKIKVDGYELKQTIHYEDGRVKNSRAKPKDKKSSDSCSAAEMSITKLDVHCNAGHGGTTKDNWFEKQNQSVTMSCDAQSGWDCEMASVWDTKDHGEFEVTDEGLAALPRNRYFGFFSYGGTERVFDSKESALAYDGLRLTDRSTYSPSEPCTREKCILTDVTIPESDFSTTTIDGKTVRYVPADKLKKADPLGPGWFIEYASLDEKTAAGSSILVGTVFWPSLVPPEGEQEACGPALTGDIGRSWQADYLTGAPDTAESFRIPQGYIQAKSRAVAAPPPEPASVISLSKTGAVSYGIIVTDPGAPPVAETLKTQRDLTSEIYWLEVPRSLHECRHVNKNACD
jgi:type IV pilus assembly protein PilY1